MIKITSRLSSYSSNNYEVITASYNNRDYTSTVSVMLQKGFKQVESFQNGKLTVNEANKLHDKIVQEYMDK